MWTNLKNHYAPRKDPNTKKHILYESIYVAVVQLLSQAQLFVTPWAAAGQASLSFTISWSLLKFMSIESVMLSNYLIVCHPLLLSLESCPASGSFPMSQVFASAIQSTGAPVLASVLPMNIQGLISFRMD